MKCNSLFWGKYLKLSSAEIATQHVKRQLFACWVISRDFFLSSVDFFFFLEIFFFFKKKKKNLLGIPSECQTIWIKIRPDVLSGLIWVQSVCKGYQQTTIVATSGERINQILVLSWFMQHLRTVWLFHSIYGAISLEQHKIGCWNIMWSHSIYYSTRRKLTSAKVPLAILNINDFFMCRGNCELLSNTSFFHFCMLALYCRAAPSDTWQAYRSEKAGLGGSVGCAVDWRPGGRGFNPRRGRQHSSVEIDHEIFSTVIHSLPLIQEEQLSVSGEWMCTILVNRLED